MRRLCGSRICNLDRLGHDRLASPRRAGDIMLHDLLAVGLLVALGGVYLDTHARGPIAQAVGAGWSPSAARRAKLNGVMAGSSIGLTGLLLMAARANGRLLPDIAELAATLSLFHATIHAATYHLLLRRLQTGGHVPSPTIDQFLDPRRLSYLDLAAYWAAICALVLRA